MSKSVKLKDSLIDAEGIKTIVYNASGTGTTDATKPWKNVSNAPTITLAKKGVYIAWLWLGEDISGSTTEILPWFNCQNAYVLSGTDDSYNDSVRFVTGQKAIRQFTTTAIIIATADNATITGSFLTFTGNYAVQLRISAVYLGKID